jgi:membrane-anchored mycosin MYCP
VRRAAVAAIVCLVAVLAAPPPPAAAAPKPGCAGPSGIFGQDLPWAQRLLNPASVWPLTTGRGVLVAVLGTGVDRTNAQFGGGQVADGTDVAGSGTPSTMDCDGRGTFAAGLIAARADPRTTFVGLAPDVRVLPVRYVQATRGGTGTVDPDLLAKAIQAAVQAHAGIICVVVPSTTDSPKLRDAVAAARAADALVVSPAVAAPNAGASGVSYPTATPGVLAVGAVGQDGAAVSTESGGYLAVAAPGQRLVSTAPGTGGGLGHIGPIDDVAFAAAFVAGTAALVRAYRPGLTADQVATRLERTAIHPAAAGGRDPRLGWGMVNPYAAVATEGADGSASASAVAAGTVVAARPAAATGGSGRRAAGLALTLVTLAGAVALGAMVRRRGRARGWRSGGASSDS